MDGNRNRATLASLFKNAHGVKFRGNNRFHPWEGWRVTQGGNADVYVWHNSGAANYHEVGPGLQLLNNQPQRIR